MVLKEDFQRAIARSQAGKEAASGFKRRASKVKPYLSLLKSNGFKCHDFVTNFRSGPEDLFNFEMPALSIKTRSLWQCRCIGEKDVYFRGEISNFVGNILIENMRAEMDLQWKELVQGIQAAYPDVRTGKQVEVFEWDNTLNGKVFKVSCRPAWTSITFMLTRKGPEGLSDGPVQAFTYERQETLRKLMSNPQLLEAFHKFNPEMAFNSSFYNDNPEFIKPYNTDAATVGFSVALSYEYKGDEELWQDFCEQILIDNGAI